LGDNDLMRAVDGDLGVVAGDHGPRSGRLDAAVGIGEIALGAIGRAAVGTAIRLAALHHARGWARSLVIWRRPLGLSLERGFGRANTLEPCRLVDDPIRHLVPALIRAVGAILLGSPRFGASKPGGHLGREPLLGLPHTSI